jgi:hypothetical protein
MKWTREMVLQKVKRTFPQHAPADVLAILDQFESESAEGQARVQLAMLFASEGNLLTLRELIDLAMTDYRDVLNFKHQVQKEFSAWLEGED